MFNYEQTTAIVTIIRETTGLDVDRHRFTDCALMLFENIPGLEIIPHTEAEILVSYLWNVHMNSKATTTISPVITTPHTSTSSDKSAITKAIAVGKKMIDGGSTKADAARAVFELIGSEPKELIVDAFVKGANLTEKGALTYWYNCRRRASKNNIS